MSAEVKKEIQLKTAHVLFMDIVGYSKLAINEQRALVETLNEIVRGTDSFREAEAAGRLIKIPVGDGMALVFSNSPEEPLECALEISRVLKNHPELQLRMGVHSGPVSGVVDVNDRANVAGAGINMAQRVMGCADAGHILVSKHTAEDLEQYPHWKPHLHDLGECEVKHGVRVRVVNLHTGELGNPEPPKKFKSAAKARRLKGVVAALFGAAALVALFLVLSHRLISRSPETSAVPEKSIAVLPFENLSANQENAFFTDGVQDEILSYLAKVADLKVISRTSVMQYKSGVTRNVREIGQQLGVAHVLEGSVQRSNNRVRVMAQLIDARNDAHLWAEHYDRDIADVFAIQSEIAKAIADQLQAKLSPSEKAAIEQAPTADVAAFELYSRANDIWGITWQMADVLQVIDLLNQAVARDPSFFKAYCTLAAAHDQLYFFGLDHTPARLALAEAAVQEAFRIRPNAGEAHLARAFHLYNGYLDYEGALAELEVARRSLPNDSRIYAVTGFIQRRLGHWEEAIRSLERAFELDPRNVNGLDQLGDSYAMARRYAEQKSRLDRILTIEPNNLGVKAGRALVEVNWKADTGPLHHLVDEIRMTNPAVMPKIGGQWLLCALAERDVNAAKDALLASDEFPLGGSAVNFTRSFAEGVIARMTNDEHKAQLAFTAARAEQEKKVQAQPDYGPAWCVLGVINAALGRKEEALREARHAVELLPVEKDAVNGMLMIKYLAMTAAWVGEKDLACEQLAIAVRLPTSGQDLSYGELKLMPFWDPLRGDPRFEKIVASLASKDAKQ
jgi:serine/threonine-protein kinase